MDKDYLTPPELAERWNVSIDMLAANRSRKRGVPYYKIGKFVRYPIKEVIAYETRIIQTRD